MGKERRGERSGQEGFSQILRKTGPWSKGGRRSWAEARPPPPGLSRTAPVLEPVLQDYVFYSISCVGPALQDSPCPGAGAPGQPPRALQDSLCPGASVRRRFGRGLGRAFGVAKTGQNLANTAARVYQP